VGDEMAIVATIISLLALGVSCATFVVNLMARSERSAESVSARMKLGEEMINEHGLGETDCFLVVQNNGALPIHSVVASIYLLSRRTRYVSTRGVLPAGATACAKITCFDGCDTAGIGAGNPVHLEFSDGKGRRWKRDKNGRLSGVTTRELRRRDAIEKSQLEVHGSLRFQGAHYRGERQEDGTLAMVCRDNKGRLVEFSHLAEE
jgi:hypothetical protein